MRLMVHPVFLRYKLLHVFLWLLIFTLIQLTYKSDTPDWIGKTGGTVILLFFAATSFYTTSYKLVPQFLQQKKLVKFILLALGLVLLMMIATFIVTRYFIHLNDRSVPFFPGAKRTEQLSTIYFWDNVLAVCTGATLKIFLVQFAMERKLLEVEKLNISTELNFLRSQVNPHFLFNMMNTIYFQIDKENVQARSSVEKLSEMLRYQLYDCTTDKININKEVDYIKNYTSVQALRLEKGTSIDLSVHESLSGFSIAPLLVLPLVENAFKHISHHKNAEENKISIALNLTGQNEFSIRVSNTYSDTNNENALMKSSGVGLQNLQRRLDLLYPNHYVFATCKNEQLFEATLKIKISD